jgi:D-hydroxyproline dehydrogenase subunit gamma
MPIKPLFSIADSEGSVGFSFDGRELSAPAGISVAAALLSVGVCDFRESVVGKVSRGPYCMMGVCFECLVEIDGVPSRQSCLIPLCAGMDVRRQVGATELVIEDGEGA